MKVGAFILTPSVARGIAGICTAVFVAGGPVVARAAGVIGTGTPASCTDAALDDALVGGGVVTFDCGLAPVTIDISTGTGTKTIAADTTIDGGGAITISGGHSVGVFSIDSGVAFTVLNLTISGGREERGGEGGGIANIGGVLTIINSTFKDNVAFWHGGGIFSREGSLTVSNSTFVHNVTLNTIVGPGEGGGIYNFSGPVTITNSTFIDNSAIGIVANGGAVTVTNSTFAGNSTSIVNRTSGLTVLSNTILVHNGVTGGTNCSGSITDGGHNLDDGTSCGFSEAHGSLSSTDPQLDPAGLRDNGGPTQTVALCTGVDAPAGCTAASPAIDAGDQAVCDEEPVNNLDQRGFVRPGRSHTDCSIGAYEVDATPEACIGDCNGDGEVSVDELVTGVTIALGTMTLDRCQAFDCHRNGGLSVDCLVMAVNDALNACGGGSSSSDLYVAASGTLDGDGGPSSPYRRITDAVARARADRATGAAPAEEEIRIHVAPGTYIGSFDATQLLNNPEYEVLPIILNVPRLAVLGATVLVRDDRGLPTGSASEGRTILNADQSLQQNQSLFLVTRTADGGVGNGVTVDGFVLDGREGPFPNLPLFVDRVSDFRISNNLIRRGSFGVTTRLASGTIEGNLLTRNDEAGGSVTGGSIAQPATVFIHANRMTANGQHGIMTLAVANNTFLIDRGSNTLDLLPLQDAFDRNNPEHLQNIPDTLAVTLSGNDLSNNGVLGLRLFAVIPEGNLFDCSGRIGYQTQDATQPLTAGLTANVLGNTLAGNGAYGVAMETGFSCRNDPRGFVVTFAGNFEGNSFVGNKRTAALFSFNGWGVSLGSADTLDTYKFADASTYQVTDVYGELEGFDYDHPVMDPVTGTVLNNTLTVNGVEAPHGTSITPE